MEDNNNNATLIKIYTFEHEQETLVVKEFPIVKLDAKDVRISIGGVVKNGERILLQGIYNKFIVRGRDGIKQPDGRFVFPFLTFKWVPMQERKHDEFCIIYNMFDEDGEFIGCKRCDRIIKFVMLPKQNETL
jgi:hypothetical protein